MAGGQERILRRRIKSVQSTKKITRAMELIAASRIVRAQARVEAAVPYSDQITEGVPDLAAPGGARGESPPPPVFSPGGPPPRFSAPTLRTGPPAVSPLRCATRSSTGVST